MSKRNFPPIESLPAYTEADHRRAVEAWRQADEREPRVTRATFDNRTRMLHLAMRNHVGVDIPVDLFPALAQATPAVIADVRTVGDGYALEWPALDVQMTTIAILQIAFKFTTQTDVARKAGKTSSPAKAAAARANGAKGGRPKGHPLAA